MKTKILIVDDDVALSQTLKAGLEQSGIYHARVENSLRKAKLAALDFQPDILLLDVIMPDKDGGMVAAEMREDSRLKDIPVMFLTSIVGKDEAKAMGGKTGDDPVLAKPVTVAEVAAGIEKLMRNRCARRVGS
ncbi:MAG: response regulator [Verrucomicrobiota bacterium]|nr:response regulator [Verrucomicrobiota bacterium]